MASPDDAPEPYYIAYIDEAGDPGLDKVRPLDPGGASEWMTLGAVVVCAEPSPRSWIGSAGSATKLEKRKDPTFIFGGCPTNASSVSVKWCPNSVAGLCRAFAQAEHEGLAEPRRGSLSRATRLVL